RAVETVLGPYLQAICVTDVAAAAASIAGLREGSVMLLETGPAAAAAASDAATLAGRVKNAPAEVARVLGQVRVADTLEAALAMRAQLPPGESVITPEGVWLGASWLRV